MRRAGKLLLGISLILALLAAALAGFDTCRDVSGGRLSAGILARWDTLPVEETDGDGPVKTDGTDGYLGILSIPAIGLSLPVGTEWNDEAGNISPCRYTGSLAGKDLIIAGHNYVSHFGKLHRLRAGDALTFTDPLGISHTYQVTDVETVWGRDVKRMRSGDWDLTLFTCTYGGRSRVTVRCREP